MGLREEMLTALERPTTATKEDLLNLVAKAYQNLFPSEKLFVNGEYVHAR